MRIVLISVIALCIVSVNAYSKPHKGSFRNKPIVGGVNTTIFKFPYQVSMARPDDDDDDDNDEENNEENPLHKDPKTSHFCGGSIISVVWVLCAAHCLDGTRPQDIVVRVGTSVPDKGGQVHEVERIIVHAKYDQEVAMDCDIALVKVKKPFEIGPNVKMIPLNKHPLLPGSIVIVTGWGTTTSGGDMPTVLQKVEVPILPFWECEWLYNTYQLTKYMFCAGRAGRDSCQGDSGGPVMFNGKQVGVVSWGEGCGLAGYPGIYTNVYEFRDWIRKNSGV